MSHTLLPFDALWPQLIEAAPRLPITSRPLAEAVGRVLATAPQAAWDLPRFDNSAMDGVAVRGQDLAGASETTPVTLTLAGHSEAGTATPPTLQPRTAVRIATGAPIPPGADTVVPIERCRIAQTHLTVATAPATGKHIRRRGEELSAHTPLLDPGRRIDAYVLAGLAAAGVTQVDVARPPVVRILATGNELVPLGTVPAPHQLVETNASLLRHWLQRHFAVDAAATIVADQEDALQQALANAADEADLILTTGGVSVGHRDLVKPTAEALGFERLLWRAAIKPGKPLYVARRNQTLLVGLPGNPAAVGVGARIVLTPTLNAMEGAVPTEPAQIPVRLSAPVKRPRDRTAFVWARIEPDATHLTAAPLARDRSHMLSDLMTADLLLVVPPGTEPYPAGTVVRAILLR